MSVKGMGFEDAVKRAKENKGNNLFIKMKDGDMIAGMPVGETFPKATHFIKNDNEKGRQFECAGDDCEICKSGEKPNVRFYLNFIMLNDTTNMYEAKILNLSSTALTQLHECLELAESPFGQSVIKIKRSGSGTDTKYHFHFVKRKEDMPEVKLADIPKAIYGEDDSFPYGANA